MSRYTYFTDELGHILETYDHDDATTSRLTPLRKPTRPPWINTPEKLAMWHSYWDNVASWWDGEMSNERREEWS